MVEYDTGIEKGGERGICKILGENFRSEIDRMLDKQEEEGGEVWAVVTKENGGWVFNEMKVGGRSEISKLDMRKVVRKHFEEEHEAMFTVHTHPSGDFMSPGDMENHAELARRFTNYIGSAMVYRDPSRHKIMAMENRGFVPEELEAAIIDIAEEYDERIRNSADLEEVIRLGEEALDKVEGYVDFCTYTY